MTSLAITTPDTNDVVRNRERDKSYSYWISEQYLIATNSNLSELYFRTHSRKDYRATVSPAKRDKDMMPDTGAEWRFMKQDGRFYYAFANIPEKYRRALGSPEALYEASRTKVKEQHTLTLKEEIEQRILAVSGIYRQHYRGYSNVHIQRLSEACAAVEIGIEMGTEKGGINCAWCMQYAAALEQIEWLQYVPLHWQRLKQKVDEVRGGRPVHEVIDLPRLGNQSRRKLQDMEVEGWIMQMRGMGQNFTNAYIMRKVSLLCELTGKTAPSESYMKELLAQPEVKFLTAAGRYGDRGRKGGMYRLYTPVERALFASDCWQVDGTRVNFIPWKNAKTGKEEHLYMIVVRDVHSGAVLGVEFCLTEDRWAYVSALSMAVNAAGHLPYELAIDRFPGHNTEEWKIVEQRMETMGVKVSYKHKATGKAQLERWFETLQTVFFQESAYYYGEGVRSNRDYAHRSPEYLKEVTKTARKDWGFDVAVAEATWCIKNYNKTGLSTYSRKHAAFKESPLELFNGCAKPNHKTAPKADRALLFGLTKTVAIRNAMIRTEIQKTEYFYNVEYDVAKHHTQVLMAYSMDDLSMVFLFPATSGKELAPVCLGVATEQKRVQVYGPDADYKALGRDNARRNRIEEQRQADYEAITQGASPVHLLLGGMSRKSEIEAAESYMVIEEFTGGPVVIGQISEQANHLTDHSADDDFNADDFVLSQM